MSGFVDAVYETFKNKSLMDAIKRHDELEIEPHLSNEYLEDMIIWGKSINTPDQNLISTLAKELYAERQKDKVWGKERSGVEAARVYYYSKQGTVDHIEEYVKFKKNEREIAEKLLSDLKSTKSEKDSIDLVEKLLLSLKANK